MRAMGTLKNIYSKMIKVKGHDVHYYTAGQGEPLVIIHGGMGGAVTWLDNVNMLADNYSMYVPDLPGFGESQLLDRDHDILAFSEFLRDFTNYLELRPFQLNGSFDRWWCRFNLCPQFPR